MSASDHDRDPYADNPELEHAATVAMTAVPVHRPESDDGGHPGSAPAGGGGKLKWLVIAAIAVLLIGGGVTAAVLLAGGDDSDGEAEQTAAASEAPANGPPTASEVPPEPSDLDEVADGGDPVAGLDVVLQPPATAEQLAAAQALERKLAEVGGDRTACRDLAAELESPRTLVVLTATTEQSDVAVCTLAEMSRARMTGALEADSDFVRAVFRWLDVSAGVDWTTLEPAFELAGAPRVGWEEVPGATERVVALMHFEADAAVQLEALALVTMSSAAEHTRLLDATMAALDSSEPALVTRALADLAALQVRYKGKVGDAAVLASRAQALLTTHPHPAVRGRALNLWWKLPADHRPALNEIVPWLGDWHPGVRSTAAAVLSEAGSPGAIHLLMPLLDDSSQDTIRMPALRKGGERVYVAPSRFDRVDGAALDAIAALSASTATPFVYEVDAEDTAHEIAAARTAARRWYRDHEAQLGAFAHAVGQPPVAAPRVEPPAAVALEVPTVVRALTPGQRVILPDIQDIEEGRSFVGWVRGWVMVAGPETTLVKSAADNYRELWIPNALVLPIERDKDRAELGAIVVASSKLNPGLYHVVEGGSPTAPRVVPTGTVDVSLAETLEPGSFMVIDTAGSVGGPAFRRDETGGLWWTQILATSADETVVFDSKGVHVLAHSDVIPLEPQPTVAAGQRVRVANAFNRVDDATVVSQDPRTRVVEVEGPAPRRERAPVQPGRIQ